MLTTVPPLKFSKRFLTSCKISKVCFKLPEMPVKPKKLKDKTSGIMRNLISLTKETLLSQERRLSKTILSTTATLSLALKLLKNNTDKLMFTTLVYTLLLLPNVLPRINNIKRKLLLETMKKIFSQDYWDTWKTMLISSKTIC